MERLKSKLIWICFSTALILIFASGCNSEAVRSLKQACSDFHPSGPELTACKKGVDIGFSHWRWGLDPSAVQKADVESAFKESLDQCHDVYRGGASAMAVRAACERGVRLVREYALGYLKLTEGKAPRVGGKNNGGGKDSVTDVPAKGTVYDRDKFNQFQDYFKNKKGDATQTDPGQ